MLPTQTRQLSFLLPSKDVDKFFVLVERAFLLFPCYFRFKEQIGISPTGVLFFTTLRRTNKNIGLCSDCDSVFTRPNVRMLNEIADYDVR